LKAKRTQEGGEVTESPRVFYEVGLVSEGPGFILSPVTPQHMDGNIGHPCTHTHGNHNNDPFEKVRYMG